METIKNNNFNNCELGASYGVNGKVLIITEVSVKQSGKCKHNLYTGTLDGKCFKELNSPNLKELIGIGTTPYNRDGGDAPKTPRKEITPESIDTEVTKIDAKWANISDQIVKLLGDEPTEGVRTILWDMVQAKKKQLREELEEKMMMQMAAKAAKAEKAKDAEKDEARKQLCAELGTTLSAVKKMAEAMGASVDEMIQNLQAMKK
jgi:hypothetical protein